MSAYVIFIRNKMLDQYAYQCDNRTRRVGKRCKFRCVMTLAD